ncbi:MAG: hypothetical protein IKE21_03730 [Erysipelotrichaceae bacterium]|nr:hypothetical protein [Erysipelotrichaceae bacterium]
MNCPVCGKEMEKGLAQGGQILSWVKEKHKLSMLPKKGEVLLGRSSFQILTFEACICKACKKVVLDYSKNNYQNG